MIPDLGIFTIRTRGMMAILIPALADWLCWVHRTFLFPSDQKIDVEHWAENTEFNPSELHQMRVQDNQLFSVSPKSGRLFPGQEQTVQLSHR